MPISVSPELLTQINSLLESNDPRISAEKNAIAQEFQMFLNALAHDRYYSWDQVCQGIKEAHPEQPLAFIKSDPDLKSWFEQTRQLAMEEGATLAHPRARAGSDLSALHELDMRLSEASLEYPNEDNVYKRMRENIRAAIEENKFYPKEQTEIMLMLPSHGDIDVDLNGQKINLTARRDERFNAQSLYEEFIRRTAALTGVESAGANAVLTDAYNTAHSQSALHLDALPNHRVTRERLPQLQTLNSLILKYQLELNNSQHLSKDDIKTKKHKLAVAKGLRDFMLGNLPMHKLHRIKLENPQAFSGRRGKLQTLYDSETGAPNKLEEKLCELEEKWLAALKQNSSSSSDDKNAKAKIIDYNFKKLEECLLDGNIYHLPETEFAKITNGIRQPFESQRGVDRSTSQFLESVQGLNRDANKLRRRADALTTHYQGKNTEQHQKKKRVLEAAKTFLLRPTDENRQTLVDTERSNSGYGSGGSLATLVKDIKKFSLDEANEYVFSNPRCANPGTENQHPNIVDMGALHRHGFHKSADDDDRISAEKQPDQGPRPPQGGR